LVLGGNQSTRRKHRSAAINVRENRKELSRMDNPETLATLAHKTHDEDKQNKSTENLKNMSNTDPSKKLH
jgi:hypothetical protein